MKDIEFKKLRIRSEPNADSHGNINIAYTECAMAILATRQATCFVNKLTVLELLRGVRI